MRKSVKKVLSGIMAGMMILTAAPISALAADYEPGDVLAKEDISAAGTISPKLDVVWTAYTGKNQAFYLNGDENWITDGKTVTDLNKVSVEGQTVGSDDCTLTANSKGEYFVAASFILHGTNGQFGNIQFKYEYDSSALTRGQRTNATTGWGKNGKLIATAEEAMLDANDEAYMDGINSSLVDDTEQFINYGTRTVDDEVVDAIWVGDHSQLINPDDGDRDAAVIIDGIYIATLGFKVTAGTKITDDLLTFNTDSDFTGYGSIAFGNEGYNDVYYTMTGQFNDGTTACGKFEVPMVNETPETKSYTVNYVTEDGTSLGTEEVEEGNSPANVPNLPTKDADANGHYSYAWDTDPTTATISDDTTFTAKLTSTAHTSATMDSNVKDATCGKNGSKTVTTYCSVCKYVISVENDVVIPATGKHSAADAVKENVKPATCETAETYDSVVYCSVCGEELSRTSMTGDAATGHKWGEWKHDDSTAKAASKHTRTCENDASHTESVACSFTSQVTQQQTADLPEITTYTCSDCGYSYTEETKPALGHTHNYGDPVADYTSGEAYVEGKAYTHTATCTGEGTCSQPTKTDKCTFDNGVVTKAATCTATGVKTFTCSECGGTYTVEIPATNHNYGAWSHVAGTEGATAQHQRVCANDASHVETAACAFSGKVTQEATVDQPEITTYTCTVCGYSYTAQTAPALDGVTVTVKAVDNGTVTLSDKDVTAGGSKKFATNGFYTLVATPNEGCTFVGWQTGNKIVSTDATYTTVAVADITYTPVFAESSKPVQFTFVDMFNNVISSQAVASGADVEIPSAPVYNGYTFTGWSVSEDEIVVATSSMTVYAQYEKDAAVTYTVTADADATVAYGSESAQGSLSGVPYGTQVTVSKDGATAWAINDKIVAYGDSYTFYVVSDVSVKAATAATQTPVVAGVSANRVSGSYKVEFVATRQMVDGATYLKAGFVYGKNLADADLDLANVGNTGSNANSGTVKAAYAQSPEGSTQYILSYGISAQTGTASARAFLTYQDQSGEVKTVYSDVMQYNYGG